MNGASSRVWLTRARFTALLCLVACGSIASHPRTPGATATRAHAERSNALRRDYAGSASCAPCHVEIYRRWSSSPMHRMTRMADRAEIRAPFDGSVFRFGTDALTVSSTDGRRYMLLAVAGQPDALYKITRVIGGRYREDFAGLRVESTAPDARVIGEANAEMVMPVSWVFSTHSWRYKGYSVMVRERPGMRAGPVWRSTCIFCHNTVPALSLLYDQVAPADAPHYQGVLRDNLLPASRTLAAEIADEGVLRNALNDEIEHLAGQPTRDAFAPMPALLSRAIHVTRDRFDGNQLIEVGIGCEACHNGSREHVASPSTHPTFEVRTAALRFRPPAGRASPTNAEWINRTCLRCHTVLFSHYPYTWEGALRASDHPGGSHINSGEARDFMLGGCSGQFSCASCHDPHTEDAAADLDAIATVAGNRVCVECHTSLANETALRSHAHHDPSGRGAVCVECHMPRKNMGLNYDLTRYHRIGSPTETARVERDRPLECALCHTDRSVESLVSTMEQWWGHRYDRGALRALYGDDLSVLPLPRTLARGFPHEQAVAIGVLSRAHDRSALDGIALQLGNEYPLVRYFALHGIARITGTLPPIDMNADGPDVMAQGRAWLDAQAASRAPSPSPP